MESKSNNTKTEQNRNQKNKTTGINHMWRICRMHVELFK